MAPEEEDIIKSSKYNEAAFKMQRLHEEQAKINKVRDKPMRTFIDPDTGHTIRGYEIWYNALVNLYFEIRSKLTKGEKEVIDGGVDNEGEKIEGLMPVIDKLLLDKPPLRFTNNYVTHQTNQPKVSNTNWLALKSILYKFEGTIKDSMEKHKFGSPEEDESSLF